MLPTPFAPRPVDQRSGTRRQRLEAGDRGGPRCRRDPASPRRTCLAAVGWPRWATPRRVPQQSPVSRAKGNPAAAISCSPPLLRQLPLPSRITAPAKITAPTFGRHQQLWCGARPCDQFNHFRGYPKLPHGAAVMKTQPRDSSNLAHRRFPRQASLSTMFLDDARADIVLDQAPDAVHIGDECRRFA